MGKYRLHKFKINELERHGGRAQYRHYTRRFYHLYRLRGNLEQTVWEGHFETIVKRKDPYSREFLNARFHIGNRGSETPWDGHFLLFGIGFFWGHSGFRKLAAWLSRCSGYKWDTRNWLVRISDDGLWWEMAQHDDMCDKHRPKYPPSYARNVKNVKKVQRRRKRSFRQGHVTLSIPELLWGPKRYSYEDLATHQALLKFEEGEYAVILTLQKCYYGRTKVDKKKHIVTYVIDVDAPRGIPTHVDHSGGWKGDRTFGWHVAAERYSEEGAQDWELDAERAVAAWVLRERAKTGFRQADPVDERGN